MFVSSQNLYIEAIILNVISFGDSVCEEVIKFNLGLKGGALIG